MTNPEVAKKNRSQVVILIIALPLMVLFGAYSLIYLAQQEGLRETTNLGEFVNPPVMARELGLTDAVGQPVDGSASWWVWVAAEDCTASCRQALAGLEQLPELLAENAAAVQLALVVGKPAVAPDSEMAATPQQFTSDGEATLADGVYIVDPAGNLILRHALTAPTMAVAEDLKKLLKAQRDG